MSTRLREGAVLIIMIKNLLGEMYKQIQVRLSAVQGIV